LRLFKAFLVNKVCSEFFLRGAGFHDVYDPTKEEFKKKIVQK